MPGWRLQYDEDTQDLVVTFPNDKRQRAYVYSGVPPDIAQRFSDTDDDEKASFFNTYIRGMY